MIHNVLQWFDERWFAMLAALVIAWVAYAVGSIVIGMIVRRLVDVNGKHHVWPDSDIKKRQDTLVALARNIWRIVIVLTLAYALLRIAIPTISTTLAPLFASAGIIGIALGFGAQALIKDFISGIFIISENQYRVGDVIELETGGIPAKGTVIRIGTRSTMLRDVEGNVHFVTNGMVGHVINKTMDFSKARLVLPVVPDTDIDKAISIINTIGETMAEEEEWKSRLITTPKYVMLGQLTATSVELIVSGKVQPSDQWVVSAELRRRILAEFEKNDIEFGVDSASAAVLAKK